MGSKTITKNRQTWKGCWKESQPTVSSRHFANDGAIWLLHYCCSPQNQWLKGRCHQWILLLCLQPAQLRRAKMLARKPVLMALFYQPALLPSSHFGVVQKRPEWTNASGLFCTKCGFTEESKDPSVLSSWSLPLTGATLLTGADSGHS